MQKTWDNTADKEKPAAIALVIGAVVAQIAIGATIDAVDRLPFIREFLELMGIAVTGVFAYRYITDPDERWARLWMIAVLKNWPPQVGN